MKVYLDDFHAEAFGLDPAEMGFFWAMWMTTWQEEGSLPSDMEQLRELLDYWFPKVHGRTFNAYVPRLLERHFKLDADGRYRNERISKRFEIDLKRVRNAAENAAKRHTASSNNNGLRRIHCIC